MARIQLRAAFDAFQHQHKPQSNSRTFDIAAVSSCFDISGDPVPRRPRTVILRQVARQLPHVGERPKRRDLGNDQRLRRRARPIRAGQNLVSLWRCASRPSSCLRRKLRQSLALSTQLQTLPVPIPNAAMGHERL
jgi:hypothetical protein